MPAALAADWLTSAWDQNTGARRDVAGRGRRSRTSSADGCSSCSACRRTPAVGFVTGAQMANFTALAAARHDGAGAAPAGTSRRTGLIGAPPLRVIAGADAARHGRPARCASSGWAPTTIVAVDADDQGRMRADALRAELAGRSWPTIVCAQAGNVNTGAVRPARRRSPRPAREAGAWLHVDGAFGLWAAAAPARRARSSPASQRADSWATDAHKWLNVPYDCGLAVLRPPARRSARRCGVPRRTWSRDGALRDALDCGAGVVPAGARLRRLGGDPRARPVGGGRARRAQLRAGPADGRPAGRAPRRRACSTRSCSTRCWSGSVPGPEATSTRTPGR